MKNNFYAIDLAREIIELTNTVNSQEGTIEQFRLQAAKYKALFFKKNELADKLEAQIDENSNSIIGEFDGYCYSSVRARATFKTLEDLVEEKLITYSEYDFCVSL